MLKKLNKEESFSLYNTRITQDFIQPYPNEEEYKKAIQKRNLSGI